MHDAEVLRAPQRLGRLREDDEHLLERDAPALVDAVAEVLADEELHHDVREPVVDPVVLHVDDVRALQQRGGLRLALEADAPVFGLGDLGAHELDGDGDAEVEVPRDPHRAHAAARELSLQAVLAGDDDVRPGLLHD